MRLRLFPATIMMFGATCIIISLAHIAIGPHAIPGGVFVNTTMDSEDRFYATLFLGWGAAMIYASRDLEARSGLLGALLLTFFLGGIARIISALLVGFPNTLFIFLGSLELLLPPLLWWWHRAATGEQAAQKPRAQ
ncbi:MAG: DUF4345 domain-containing protein [Bradyrhizobium sp.]|nr:DUF4345 domain-containing protein [Bradyrhizobium sp.]